MSSFHLHGARRFPVADVVGYIFAFLAGVDGWGFGNNSTLTTSSHSRCGCIDGGEGKGVYKYTRSEIGEIGECLITVNLLLLRR